MYTGSLIPEIEKAEEGFSRLSEVIVPEAEKARTGLTTLNNNINGAQIGSGALGTTGGGGADFTDAAEALIGAIDNVVNTIAPGTTEQQQSAGELMPQVTANESQGMTMEGGLNVSHSPINVTIGGTVGVDVADQKLREEIRQAVNEELLKILQKQGGNHETISRSRLPIKE